MQATPPLEVIWKWTFVNLTEEVSKECTEAFTSKPALKSTLISDLGRDFNANSSNKVLFILVRKCMASLFPSLPALPALLKDPLTDIIAGLRRTTEQEKQERSHRIPPLPEPFRKALLLEIRTELNQRPSGSSLKKGTSFSCVPTGTLLNFNGGESLSEVPHPRPIPAIKHDDPESKKRKATPPASPNKRPRVDSKALRRSTSESSLFPSSSQFHSSGSLVIPTPFNLSKLENRLHALEANQRNIQQELAEIRHLVQQLHNSHGLSSGTVSDVSGNSNGSSPSSSASNLFEAHPKPTNTSKE